MASNNQEVEVKFAVAALTGIEAKLVGLQASLEQPRLLEVNLRFDTPRRRLRKAEQVLRLRKDSAARMTFKGAGSSQSGVQVRQEIEFTVGDFALARQLLQALGFQVVMMYEKYRRVYRLGDTLITLDEMPYGDFIEIEGLNADTIQAVASQLGLNWERRVLPSYTSIFERLRDWYGWKFMDLSFHNFSDLQPRLEILGILAGDQD